MADDAALAVRFAIETSTGNRSTCSTRRGTPARCRAASHPRRTTPTPRSRPPT
jgi:hypothetical protein